MCQEDYVDFHVVNSDNESDMSHLGNEYPVDELVSQDGVYYEPQILVDRLDVCADGGSLRELSVEEELVLRRLREVYFQSNVSEIPSLKGKDRLAVSKEVKLVNNLLHNVCPDLENVTAVNNLLYAGSFIVCERMGLVKPKKQIKKADKPWWQRRLEGSITQWRKDLRRIGELKKGIRLKERIMVELERRYKLRERGTRSVLTFLENKVRAASNKIKNFNKSNQAVRQNKLFNLNQKLLYKELGGMSGASAEPPNKNEARNFWSEI